MYVMMTDFLLIKLPLSEIKPVRLSRLTTHPITSPSLKIAQIEWVTHSVFKFFARFWVSDGIVIAWFVIRSVVNSVTVWDGCHARPARCKCLLKCKRVRFCKCRTLSSFWYYVRELFLIIRGVLQVDITLMTLNVGCMFPVVQLTLQFSLPTIWVNFSYIK
jgi:hypothetical protein